MSEDLDKLEAIATAAQADTPKWEGYYVAENIGPPSALEFIDVVTPDVVLRLIARIRHYEQTIAKIAQEAPWLVTGGKS